MLEQEIASAIKFILESAGNPAPYYWNVPQDFAVPAVYFPVPEITSGGDTLNSYNLNYTWFIKFFHKDTQSAHELATAALTALQSRRNLIPLINETRELTDRGFRTKDPELKEIDGGAVQLTLSWNSPRPYHKEQSPKVMKYYLAYITKQYDKAIKQIHETED